MALSHNPRGLLVRLAHWFAVIFASCHNPCVLYFLSLQCLDFLLNYVVGHRLEHTFGSFGTSHLCVTEAMKNDLALNWGISYLCYFLMLISVRALSCRANVLHDKPPECFHRRTVSDLHHLFSRIAVNAPEVTRGFGGTRNANVGADETLLTCLNAAGFCCCHITSYLCVKFRLKIMVVASQLLYSR